MICHLGGPWNLYWFERDFDWKVLDYSWISFLDSPTKTASPAKAGVEKRNIGKENISSDEDVEERDEDDADLDHNDAHLFHRRYFESAKRSKTSDKVLTLNRERLQTEMENLKSQNKMKSYSHMFDEWTLYSAQGYSIFLTGLGLVWTQKSLLIPIRFFGNTCNEP